MTLRHIKVFLALCENGYNTTKAAEALRMAQPAVSLAISELESYYGVKLFERLSRRLYITEAGKRFEKYASHINQLFDYVEKDIRDWDTFGVLRIGASISIGSQLMPDYIRTYSERHPGIDVRVYINRSDKLEEGIMRNDLDLALIEGIVHEPEIVSEDFMEDSLTAICSARGSFQKNEAISLDKFKNQRFLLREQGSGTRELFDDVMKTAGVSITPVWESISTTALINAVINGLGIAVLPRSMLKDAINSGLVYPISVQGIDFGRKFKIICHKNKFITHLAKEFIDLCKSSNRTK